MTSDVRLIYNKGHSQQNILDQQSSKAQLSLKWSVEAGHWSQFFNTQCLLIIGSITHGLGRWLYG